MKINVFHIHFIITLVISVFFTRCSNEQEMTLLDFNIQSEYSIESEASTNPLKSPDTSSPQATLRSFIESMNRSYRLLMIAHRKNAETTGIFTSDSVKYIARKAVDLFERGVYCLDLSNIPPALRRLTEYEKALKLKEILDRIDLPPYDQIPDAKAVEKEEERKFPRLHR